MALTKITQGVIKPDENYKTGIITASQVNASGIITATESEIAFFKTQNYSRSWPYVNWSNSQPGVTLQSIGRNIIIQAGGAQTTRSYVSLTNGGGVWIGGGTGSTEGVNIEAGAGDVKITGGNVGIGSIQPTAKLDVNGTLNVSGVSTFQSHVHLGDSDELRLGDSDDLQIYHDSNHSQIDHVGTGNLYVRQLTNDKDVIIQSDDGSGGLANYVRAQGFTGEVHLSHYGNLKLATKSTGIDVTGLTSTTNLNVSGISTFSGHVHLGDDDELRFGAGNDFKIVHDPNDCRFENSNGDIKFKNTGSYFFFDEDGGETLASFINDGAVNLYHDNSKKFETVGTGVTVYGDAYIGSDNSRGVILTSPNGTQYRLIVANDGTLSTTSV